MKSLPLPSFDFEVPCGETEEDRVITREEAIALRDWMQGDACPLDECPELPDYQPPDDEDAAWWLRESDAPAEPILLRHAHVSARLSLAMTESPEPRGAEHRWQIRGYRDGEQAALWQFDTLPAAEAEFDRLLGR